jgi:hypothetical protein
VTQTEFIGPVELDEVDRLLREKESLEQEEAATKKDLEEKQIAANILFEQRRKDFNAKLTETLKKRQGQMNLLQGLGGRLSNQEKIPKSKAKVNFGETAKEVILNAISSGIVQSREIDKVLKKQGYRSSADVTLGQMVKEKTIKRVGRGIYGKV